MIKIILTIKMTAIFCFISVFAQSETSLYSKLNGQITAKCNSDYSINYIKSGQKESEYSDEGNDRIWLKLKNESKKTLKFTAATGTNTYNYLRGIGKELDFYYEVVKKENCQSEDKEVEELPIGYTRVDTYYTINLKPGQSFIFSMASQYFSSNRAIYITYECSQKCEKEEKNKLKKAYFFWFELPENIRQDK